MTQPRVVVLTAPGCHLCENACAVVARVAADTGVEWREQDVRDDPELLARWRDRVPVVYVDGKLLTWFRVGDEELRAALGSVG